MSASSAAPDREAAAAPFCELLAYWVRHVVERERAGQGGASRRGVLTCASATESGRRGRGERGTSQRSLRWVGAPTDLNRRHHDRIVSE